MKKIIIWTAIMALALTAAGCAAKNDKEHVSQKAEAEEPYESEDNDFLANASPETSALAFYQYDGKAVTREFLFDTKEVKKVLKELSKVRIKEALDWSPEQVTAPIYGVDIGGKDGYTVFGVWSNGYWITEDGMAYEYDYDFETEGISWFLAIVNENNEIIAVANSAGEIKDAFKMLAREGYLEVPEDE
jgi:hypothetical protein